MKKIIIILLSLLAFASYGQAEFEKVAIKENVETASTTKIVSQQPSTGELNYINATALPVSTAVQDSINKKINLPTGFLQGLQLSINADPTKFNIAPGYYVVTDFTNLANPVVKIITYPGATGLTPAYLATANSTYVALDINGNVVSSASPFTNADRRTLAIVGNVVHSNNTTINVTNEIKAPIVASTNQVHDFMRAIGFLNEEGNIYSSNGANLQIDKSAGKIFGMGINSADYLNPHQLSIPAQTALTFAYRLRTGTQYANATSIDPNNWDNAGVLTSVPVGNRWTIQRINLFQSGLTRIQYGQTVYTSYNDAVTALPTQSFVTEQNIADNAVFRCYLIVQQGTTNLASAVAAGTALFVPVDKFGNVIGNGSVALTYANIVAALGYTPENVANKSDSYTVSSSITYASTNALVGGLATKVNGTNASDFYRNIYYMGDSLTEDGTYVYAISANLGATWYNYNAGISGENTTQMLARFNTDVVSKKNPSHVVILGGTNDVTALVSAATIESNLQAMYTAARTAGIKVIAVTITPRTTTGGQLAIQNAVNTWIKTIAVDVDYIVDPYTTLADPSNPTQLLPAYTTDGLHMTTLGYTTLGTYIYNNATWTAKENNYNLKIDVKGYAAANQELYTNSDALFKTINNITVGRGAGNVVTNTAVGRKALNSNTYGRYNVGIGNIALSNNTSGYYNVGIGHEALLSNTTGLNNVAIGSQPLNSNTTGEANIALGNSALYSNTIGGGNIALGQSSLRANTTVSNLIAIGNNALLNNTTGTNNVSIGSSSLSTNTIGANSVAIGTLSLYNNTSGTGNIGIGLFALTSNTNGGGNIALGQSALNSNITGGDNIGIGLNTLYNKTSGDRNISIGNNSGRYIADASTPLTNSYNSIFIGQDTRANTDYSDNEIVIGYNTIGLGSNTASLGTSSTVTTRLFGDLKLPTVPTTSAGAYDILTRNTSTGVVEKIASNTIATIASPAFTGTPTAPTAAPGTNTTQIATMEALQAHSSSGTYTPTLTNTTNITSSTLNAAYYVRNGNLVTVTIAVQLTLTATADTVFTFSLPVSGATVVNGIGQGNLTSGAGAVNAYGIVDTTNSTTAQLRIGSTAVAGSGAGVANIIFTYSL